MFQPIYHKSNNTDDNLMNQLNPLIPKNKSFIKENNKSTPIINSNSSSNLLKHNSINRLPIKEMKEINKSNNSSQPSDRSLDNNLQKKNIRRKSANYRKIDPSKIKAISFDKT